MPDNLHTVPYQKGLIYNLSLLCSSLKDPKANLSLFLFNFALL